MEIAGVTFTERHEEIIPIIRGTKESFILAQAIPDMSVFEEICPVPKPPKILKPGKAGGEVSNMADPKYREAVDEHDKLRLAWMVVTSIKNTPGLVFSKIDPDNPATWMLYLEEFKESGLTEAEINRIIMGVMAANTLDGRRIESAKQSFLVSRQQALDTPSSQTDDQPNTPSGEPVNASA